MGKLVKGPHEDITYRIIGAAMAVHRRIGPGQWLFVPERLKVSVTDPWKSA
jgi:hypothetical protein